MKQNLLFLTILISMISILPSFAFSQQYWTISQLGVKGTAYDIGRDNNGNVHIIWFDDPDLFYGKIVNGVVTGKETIPRGGTSVHTRFTRPRLGVRPDGTSIHTCWIDFYGGGGIALRHAWKDSNGSWHNEQAWSSSGSYYIAYPSVGADLNGIVHVIAQKWNNYSGSSIYGRKSGSTWSWYTITSGPWQQQVSFTDKNGGFHATWRSLGNPGEYRYCASGGNLASSPTLYVPIVPGTNTPSLGDLFVSDNGDVHNTFLSFSVGQVDYYVKRAGSNTFGELSHPSNGAYRRCKDYDAWPAVIANDSGQVVAAYGEQTNCAVEGFNQLIVAYYSNGSWVRYTIDQNAYIYFYSKPAMTQVNNVGYLVWRGGSGYLLLARSGVESSLRVISPNGNESWLVGSTYTITWSSEGTVGNVKIEYSTNNGSNWSTITSSTPNDGSHPWTIPSTTSSQCKVRISEASDGSPWDSSDATFSIASAGNAPQISLNRSQLNFGYAMGSPTPPSQTFLISNSRSGTLHWSAGSSSSWVKLSPTSGTGPGAVTVSLDVSGVSPGIYIANVSVSDPNASNSPQVLTISLRVYSSGALPFGSFDTPADGATARSSIPVTGWALDDTGIDNVKIYREDGGNLVYIGDAVLVEGARPDIETSYPTYPMSYRAGWGYMMLTNFLPNGGNGTFPLYAVATDSEGNPVTLGVKTINCDNANAIKPFGAIDTPAQGGIASGTSFKNNGWVLASKSNNIPTNGSTIFVYVDGVKLGNPKYNLYRPDIFVLFPGYANILGAGASYTLNTASYSNGVHTIMWTASDNAGNSDGIGSRYFTIQNTGSSAAQPSAASVSSFGVSEFGEESLDLPDTPRNFSLPVSFKKGFDDNNEGFTVFPDNNGIIPLEIKELERIVIYLGEEGNKLNYHGYLLVGNHLKPLPIGSTFDSVNGVFYWLPGPGFIGDYRLVFVSEGPGEILRKDIIITIN